MADDRTKRLLSPRTRQFGRDIAFLEQQIHEKQENSRHHQETLKADHEHLLKVESVRQTVHKEELRARRCMRQATDAFNAQPKPQPPPAKVVTPGVSALLEFAGELPPPNRRAELVKGLAAQVEEVRAQKIAERKAAAASAKKVSQQTGRRSEIESAEDAERKRLLLEALDVNAQLIEAKNARDAQEQLAAAAADAADIEKSLERVQHKRTVILSLEEQKRILDERAAQVAANERRRQDERRAKEAEDEHMRQMKVVRDQVNREELQERRSLEMQTVQDNLASMRPLQPPSLALDYGQSIFGGFGVSGR